MLLFVRAMRTPLNDAPTCDFTMGLDSASLRSRSAIFLAMVRDVSKSCRQGVQSGADATKGDTRISKEDGVTRMGIQL